MVTETPVSIALPVYVILLAIGILLIYKLVKDRTRKVSSLRLFIQIAAVVAIFMGIIIGPFNLPAFLPLGPSPRDHLVGANLLGNQFPDGISFPVLACYYPNGRTVTCPIWQLQAYIFPFGITQEATKSSTLPQARKNRYSRRLSSGSVHHFRAVFLWLALSFRFVPGCVNKNSQSVKETTPDFLRKNKHSTWAITLHHYCYIFNFKRTFCFLRNFWR